MNVYRHIHIYIFIYALKHINASYTVLKNMHIYNDIYENVNTYRHINLYTHEIDKCIHEEVRTMTY